MAFRLLAYIPPEARQRQTVVVCESNALIERQPGQPVHYRKNDDDPQCARCGGEADIWLGDPDKWEEHRDRCC